MGKEFLPLEERHGQPNFFIFLNLKVQNFISSRRVVMFHTFQTHQSRVNGAELEILSCILPIKLTQSKLFSSSKKMDDPHQQKE